MRTTFRASLRIGENGNRKMMKPGTPSAALAALLLVTTAGGAADIPGWCRYALSDALKSAPKFES